MASQPLLVLFLEALVASCKSLGLYPAGSEMAMARIQRLHIALSTASSSQDVSVSSPTLNAMIRTAGLYLPAHPQSWKAKDTRPSPLTWLARSPDRSLRRDLLIANDRILPRENLVSRRVLDACQIEKGIGSVPFSAGIEPREVDALPAGADRGSRRESGNLDREEAMRHLGAPTRQASSGVHRDAP